MLKICTDTYKIIDKNIPLLTIRLGGKPCERLGGGGVGGWLAGGSRAGGVGGIVEEDEEAWAVVLLGLGLLLGLLGGSLHLRDEADRTGSNLRPYVDHVASSPKQPTSPAVTNFLSRRSTHLVGLGLSVLRVVFLVCLCLCVLLRLLGLLVLLLVVHSLFFLQW